jgi:hypothetical protein
MASRRGLPGRRWWIRDPVGLTVGVVGHPGFVFNDLEETWQTTHRLQREFGSHPEPGRRCDPHRTSRCWAAAIRMATSPST